MSVRNSNHVTARDLRGCLLVCLLAGCATDPTPTPEPADGTEATTAHALGASAPDPGKAASMIAQASGRARPGTAVQIEPRLGVPTFLWTRAQRPGPNPRASASAGARPEVAAARAAVADHASLYGLADADVAGAVVASVHDRGTGPVLVKLRAQRGGIEIFGEEMNVVMTRRLDPVALSGYITSAATPAARPGGLAFSLAAPAAAATAINLLAGAHVDASQLVAAGARDGYQLFDLAPAAGIALDEQVRVKRVYFHLAGGLEAAYYVEVQARTGPAPDGIVTADGSALATPEAQAYVVSAATGQQLFAKNLIADAGGAPRETSALDPGGFTYRVWADAITGIPSDTPAGNAVHPKVVASPDGAQAAFVATADVQLPNFPFSQSDPWLAPGATETNGNNVDAFLNLFSPDGLGNPVTTAPVDPANGDFRAQITAAGQFLHAQIPDGNPGFAEGRQGAIQQLFYNVNFLHDWFYDVGFNEAAGNAQTNNFGRGGTGNDSIRAQAQDFSGFNNANMTTGADGVRPRMRMYMFPSPANHLEVTAPGALAGKYGMGISMSGPQAFDVTTDIVRSTFSNSPAACTVTNAASLAGKIAMFDFDNTDGTGCSFTTRIARLTTTTAATGILLVYTAGSPGTIVSITGYVTTNTKPVFTVPWNTGQLIKAQLALPVTVSVRAFRAPDRDGSLDNQIVFHEFFHYVSNRLIGNGTGLGTQQAVAMGEGWSDFNSMLLTARADDTATPSNAAFDGAYAFATYATSGVPYSGAANHGYYFGIRRYPYSTDMTRNPLTFRHISNGVALPVGPPVAFGADGSNNAEVHNAGEVWTSMLWECYAALLRDTLGASPRLTFQQAQDRMKQYLISALKITPLFPTFVDARDALLAVAFATDLTDYIAFRIAFAKRGAGPHAVAPDRFSTDLTGVVEDFATGPELTFVGATLDDSLGSCDSDGALDHGEFGKLTVTLRNTGTVALSATTATITASTSDVWFPNGTTLAFPAMAPGAIASASLRLAYLDTVSGIQVVDFQIDYTDGQITGGPATEFVGFRTNTDEIAGSSATDTVEPVAPPWTTGFDPVLGNIAPWHRVAVTPLDHVWHVDDPDGGSDQYLVSPLFTVDGSGAFNVQFDHTWSFEFDAGGNYDGGVIEMSVNGGAFNDIGAPAYNGTIVTYTGDVNPLRGRPGFVQNSVGVVHTSLTQAIAPGSTVQIRFRAGSDGGVGAQGWDIDDISFTGVVETPFAIVVPDGDACSVVPTSADLAITVTDGVTSVVAGDSVTYTITAVNAGGDDIVGATATVTDNFPADLTCTWTCAGAGGGTCPAAGGGSLILPVELPVGGSVTITATCAVAAATPNNSLVNTATISLPGPVTDPVPGNNSATDIDAILHLPAQLIGSKTASGSFTESSIVTYLIVLDNIGTGRQSDNPGNELVDVLPAGLTLLGANASSGTAVATLATNTVTWNGAIAAGDSVTIGITALINASAGTLISNQATFNYDSDGNATNDATGTTDAYQCNL